MTDLVNPDEPGLVNAKLVSRADLARIAGVSRCAITKACRRTLAPAMRGTRVELDHPAVVAYLAKALESPGASRPPVPAAPPAAELDALADLVIDVLERALAHARARRARR